MRDRATCGSLKLRRQTQASENADTYQTAQEYRRRCRFPLPRAMSGHATRALSLPSLISDFFLLLSLAKSGLCLFAFYFLLYYSAPPEDRKCP